MHQEDMRTLAYICPACRQPVVIERSVFQLAAAPNRLSCPCGKSELGIEIQGDTVKLTVPCLFCKHDHSAVCSTRAFLYEKTLAFSCAASGLDCCYVGEEGPVFAAVCHMEEAADKLSPEEEENGAFLDENVMQEVLGEVRDIARRDGVKCACGSAKWSMKVKYSAVELICDECGAMLRIPAAVADDIDSVCCKDSIIIGRKKD